MSQSAYIDTALKRFSMTDCRPLLIPMDPHVLLKGLTIDNNKRAAMRTNPYAALVGTLMYAAVRTRPHITFAVLHLSQAMSDPLHAHWEAAKQVLRYLQGTKTLGIAFGAGLQDNEGLFGYTNATWASQPGRRSISGSIFFYGGGAVDKLYAGLDRDYLVFR
jgi:hypothetical protein